MNRDFAIRWASRLVAVLAVAFFSWEAIRNIRVGNDANAAIEIGLAVLFASQLCKIDEQAKELE